MRPLGWPNAVAHMKGYAIVRLSRMQWRDPRVRRLRVRPKGAMCTMPENEAKRCCMRSWSYWSP